MEITPLLSFNNKKIVNVNGEFKLNNIFRLSTEFNYTYLAGDYQSQALVLTMFAPYCGIGEYWASIGGSYIYGPLEEQDNNNNIRPSINLSSNVVITSGFGTKEEPFEIAIGQ